MPVGREDRRADADGAAQFDIAEMHGLDDGRQELCRDDVAIPCIVHFAEPEDCFYIGDTPSDVIEAQNAGVECLSAAWDPDTDRDTLNRINPGKVFESIEEIKDYITAKKR